MNKTGVKAASMAEDLALLRGNLAVRGRADDVPARLGVAYEAFEFLTATLEADGHWERS